TFFFQAEDGIRDFHVTGVQTCALPISLPEIYAVGMRDPHRISWDTETGRMYLGHIGEWQIEAIYEVQPGDNFGWSDREGPFVAENRQIFPLPEDDAQYGLDRKSTRLNSSH